MAVTYSAAQGDHVQGLRPDGWGTCCHDIGRCDVTRHGGGAGGAREHGPGWPRLLTARRTLDAMTRAMETILIRTLDHPARYSHAFTCMEMYYCAAAAGPVWLASIDDTVMQMQGLPARTPSRT